MTEAEEIIILEKNLGDMKYRYNRVLEENNTIRKELDLFKKIAKKETKGWYLGYLQNSLTMIERQYEQLQNNFRTLNTRYAQEMAKRQYIFPSNPSMTPKVEDHFDHREYEQT